MPEGPSIVILKEASEQFTGQEVLEVSGDSKIDLTRLLHKKVLAFKTWGKHFLICFDGFTIRIHLLMFGSYLINEKKDREPRLSLTFKTGEINFYTCAVKVIEGDINEAYDFTADIMNDNWDAKAAKKKLEKTPDKMICDALMEQEIFSGLGNIIKNEVLFIDHIHPESLTGKIPATVINTLIKEVRSYSFDFLKWKKNFELKKHFLAHTKKICPRCNIPFTKKQTGVKKRRSFYCENCQVLYK